MTNAETRTWRLLQAVPDPLVVVDGDGVIELINAQAVVLFGYQPDELIGQPVERLIPSGMHEAHRRHRVGYIVADEPSPMATGPNIVAVRKDGSIVPVEITLSAITMSGGHAVLASVRDVSERRLAEAKLRISDERFRVSFDSAPIGMALIDLRPGTVGRFLSVNHALCRLTGFSEAELLATTSTAVTHPDDRAQTAASLQTLVDGAAARWESDQRYRRTSGEDIWVHFAVSVVHDAVGAPVYGVSHVHDITDRKHAETLLQERFHELATNVDVGFLVRQLDPPEILYCNPAFLTVSGFDSAGPAPTPPDALARVHPADAERVTAALRVAATGRRVEQEWRFIHPDGQLRWVSGRVCPIVDGDGQIRRVVGVFEDITDRKDAEAVLAESREQFRELADNVDVGFSIRDAGKSTYVYLNSRFQSIFGFDPDACWPTVEQVTALIRPAADVGLGEIVPDLATAGRTSSEWPLVLPDGTQRWIRASTFPVLDNNRRIHRVVGIVEDITDRRATEAALAESQDLRHTALHDALTGLPNRALLMDRLESALARAERTQREVSLFFCDLDWFKRVNDIAGHAAGDRVLLEISRRLRDVLRDGDTVARIGGDEFVIIVEPWSRKGGDDDEPADPYADRVAAVRIAERIGAAVRQPITINGVEHVVSVSIGITHVGLAPRGHLGGSTAEEILQDADTAMYRAKREGKDRFAVFEHRMRADAEERARVEKILRQALRLGDVSDQTGPVKAPVAQLSAVYQPIFDAGTGALVGFEALARLVDPAGRSIAPDVFIPIAEDSGLIRALGTRMLDLACGQLATWRISTPGIAPLTMAVNISALQAQYRTLAGDVDAALRRHALIPADLVLELTETVLLDADQTTITTLKAMNDAGMGIAIDDFGTGYASLWYLATLPISALKVDRSFTAELPDNRVCRSIIDAVAGLAANLHLSCIIEGVETEAQRQALPEGVQLQGYLTGRPQPADLIDLPSLAGRRRNEPERGG